MTWLLKLIPIQYRLAAAVGAAVIAIVTAFGAGWKINGWRLEKDFSDYKMASEMARSALIIQHQTESDRLQKEKDDAIAKAQTELKAHQVALGNSVAAHNGLLKSAAAAAARARAGCQNPAPGPGIQTATDPISVLANVLGRADERAGALAKYAGELGIALASCNRQYESLKPN